MCFTWIQNVKPNRKTLKNDFVVTFLPSSLRNLLWRCINQQPFSFVHGNNSDIDTVGGGKNLSDTTEYSNYYWKNIIVIIRRTWIKLNDAKIVITITTFMWSIWVPRFQDYFLIELYSFQTVFRRWNKVSLWLQIKHQNRTLGNALDIGNTIFQIAFFCVVRCIRWVVYEQGWSESSRTGCTLFFGVPKDRWLARLYS